MKYIKLSLTFLGSIGFFITNAFADTPSKGLSGTEKVIQDLLALGVKYKVSESADKPLLIFSHIEKELDIHDEMDLDIDIDDLLDGVIVIPIEMAKSGPFNIG